MSNRFNSITGGILVGGKSRRMGQDKALLELNGQPLAGRIIQTLQTCFDHLLLVGDKPERFADYTIPVIPDIYPGSSLGGLYTGLKAAATEHIFVTSCDIPFPNPALISLICSRSGSHDAVIPASCSGLEPLFACYRKTCLPVMQQALEAGNYRITSLLDQLQTLRLTVEELHTLDPDGRGLLNINTPHDYAACREFSA